MGIEIGITPEERAAQRAAAQAVLDADTAAAVDLSGVRITAPTVGADGVLRGETLIADSLRIAPAGAEAVLAWAKLRAAAEVGATSAQPAAD